MVTSVGERAKTALAIVGAPFLCAVVVEASATLVKDVHIDTPGIDGHPTAGRIFALLTAGDAGTRR